MNYPLSHIAEIRVNYFDTDQMGVVWHGNYIKYFEMAREELFRTLHVKRLGVIVRLLPLPGKDCAVEGGMGLYG